MFRQVHITLVVTVTISVLVDSRTVHPDQSLGIIGGQEAIPHEAKFTVRLKMFQEDPSGERTYFELCGGVLISEKYIISAKHCIEKMHGTLVYLGSHDRVNTTGDEMQTVYKNKFILHRAADIALIELPSSVTYNENIKNASLPLMKDANETYVGQNGTAFGWGYLSDKRDFSRYLMKVNLTVVENSGCPTTENYQLCTSGNSPEDPKGTCGGDSGGPFVINDVVVALTVRGPKYCERGGPSIYISVGRFLEWIGKKTGIVFPVD